MATEEEQEVIVAPSNSSAGDDNDHDSNSNSSSGGNSGSSSKTLDRAVEEKMGALQDMFKEFDALDDYDNNDSVVGANANTTSSSSSSSKQNGKTKNKRNKNKKKSVSVSATTPQPYYDGPVDLDDPPKMTPTIPTSPNTPSKVTPATSARLPPKSSSKTKQQQHTHNNDDDMSLASDVGVSGQAVVNASSMLGQQTTSTPSSPAAPAAVPAAGKKTKTMSVRNSSGAGGRAGRAGRNSKRTVLQDETDNNNDKMTRNNKNGGDRNNRKSSVNNKDTAAAAATAGALTIGLKTATTNETLPSPTGSNDSSGTMMEQSKGTSSPTSSESPFDEYNPNDSTDELLHDIDLTDEKRKVGAAAAAAKGSSYCSRTKCIMWTCIFITVCVLLGVIVVSLRATENLGQGTKGLIAAFDVTSSPSESPSDQPSLGPSIAPSDVPSFQPSDFPSSLPSQYPSDMPSQTPTDGPTPEPSDMPSLLPSSAPSQLPSTDPTIAPTYSVFIRDPNPVPANPGRGYFNYDDDTRYGPSRWGSVNTQDHPLRELGPNGFGPFRGHLGFDPVRNVCGGPERRQSPKYMRQTTACEAYHEIRTRCGKLPVTSPKFERLILPHKLSLVMNRRPCTNVNPDSSSHECEQDHPPLADYPRYSARTTPFSDLLNFDIKIPGEHTMEDAEPFDAEIQMLHTHLDPDPDRMNSLSIPIRATDNGYNAEFQAVIEQFQAVYDSNKEACALKRRQLGSRRMLRTAIIDPVDGLTENSTLAERTLAYYNISSVHSGTPSFHRRLRKLIARDQYVRFDPYSEAFMRDINFYRYDGSITEPPCLPITWWVMIEPMFISRAQLRQLEVILFTHVDANCNPTSVHNSDMAVTRPIYSLGQDREIQGCKDGSFESDIEKGKETEGNRCNR